MIQTCWYCNQEFKTEKISPHKDLDGGLLVICTFCGSENIKEEEDMPNLNDLSEFLKRDDIKAGDIITFVNEGEIADVDFSKAKDGSGIKKVFQIKVQLLDGREKIATINRTSQESLGAVWGKDTSIWVNKQAKVNFIKQLAFGKQIEVLVLEPIE